MKELGQIFINMSQKKFSLSNKDETKLISIQKNIFDILDIYQKKTGINLKNTNYYKNFNKYDERNKSKKNKNKNLYGGMGQTHAHVPQGLPDHHILNLRDRDSGMPRGRRSTHPRSRSISPLCESLITGVCIGAISILFLLIYPGKEWLVEAMVGGSTSQQRGGSFFQNIIGILCCLSCVIIAIFIIRLIIRGLPRSQSTGGKKKSIKRNSRYHKKKDGILRKTKLKIKKNNIRYNKSGGERVRVNRRTQKLIENILIGLGYMLMEGCWQEDLPTIGSYRRWVNRMGLMDEEE